MSGGGPAREPVQDLAADYRDSGFGASLGCGTAPAVLAIDLARAYLVDGSPLRAPVEGAVAAAGTLIGAARAAGLPVLHTRVVLQPGGADGGLFARKVPALRVFEEGSPLGGFAEGAAPEPGETVVTKQYASAFHGTSLAATLTSAGIDTLLICGLTTSGCIRASATDALQHGFRPLVVDEACGDRDRRLHEANLLDLEAKYADVLSLDRALDTIKTASAGP
ncbi:isochorismatase family protein [Actinomadura livida]|uniref:Nicotinamidase-related amidase n=1 Tax=Actinomadura livida TaxID=79909 RepID=A0A7W7MVF7_9ACTN|nr:MULTISPECIES: isochorismatase family protein [Actinomadura]MBB4772508.1 nicotinamidase-related amidase [Actinomadura catellatispora]